MDKEEAIKILKDFHDKSALFSIRTALETLHPDLKESEDEKTRKALISFLKSPFVNENITDEKVAPWLAWLEKQGEKPSAIRWYDASLIPQEMEELLVEWESEDATWHEIAFYHADTKTFWDGTRQVKNVTRWCYIIDLLEKQAAQKPFDYENANIQQKDFAPQVEQKLAWNEEDECYMGECIGAIATKDGWSFEEKRKTKHWLKAFKDRYTWKPSDEQITVLELASKYERVFTPKQIDILIGLKEQLKKLRGE
jgi:hypothetical protein